jgi:uncharacterized LabA/DUF88 family protein
MNTICFAYIDGANLEHGVVDLGWELDYKRFRVWLTDKYLVTTAYFFIGKLCNRVDVYAALREAGFALVFKETIKDRSGKVKGNCDAELILAAVVDYFEQRYAKAVLISSDGDYSCLVRFWKGRNTIVSVISPRNKCSKLLTRTDMPIVYLDTQRGLLELNSGESLVDIPPQNEKALDGDETP